MQQSADTCHWLKDKKEARATERVVALYIYNAIFKKCAAIKVNVAFVCMSYTSSTVTEDHETSKLPPVYGENLSHYIISTEDWHFPSYQNKQHKLTCYFE